MVTQSLSALLALLLTAAAAGAQPLNVIPRPTEARALVGTFTLRSPVRIVVPESAPRIREIGDWLGAVIRTRTGYSARVTNDAALGAITLDTTLASGNAEATRWT